MLRSRLISTSQTLIGYVPCAHSEFWMFYEVEIIGCWKSFTYKFHWVYSSQRPINSAN